MTPRYLNQALHSKRRSHLAFRIKEYSEKLEIPVSYDVHAILLDWNYKAETIRQEFRKVIPLEIRECFYVDGKEMSYPTVLEHKVKENVVGIVYGHAGAKISFNYNIATGELSYYGLSLSNLSMMVVTELSDRIHKIATHAVL